MVRDIPKTTDAMLDHIGAQSRDKGDALDAIGRFLLEHPEYDTDEHLAEARLGVTVTDIERLVNAQADPNLFECPVCESQYTSRLAAAECCDPAWEDS